MKNGDTWAFVEIVYSESEQNSVTLVSIAKMDAEGSRKDSATFTIKTNCM